MKLLQDNKIYSNNLTFLDFCAGIGGGRLGLTQHGLMCLGHSEIDEMTAFTYASIHKDNRNYGDLMKVNPKELPNFDVLISGFPCQAFSIVGKRKGFEDSRGIIINGLIDILKEKNVPYFIFENVKGLVNHDQGHTFQTILKKLDQAGYYVSFKVLDSINFGVPQMRERIYLFGYKKDLGFLDFSFDNLKQAFKCHIKDFLIDENNQELNREDATFVKYLNNKYNKGKFNLDDLLAQDYLVIDTRQSDLRLYHYKVPTLRTGRHGILYVKNKKLKKLSAKEAFLLQGFSEDHAEIAISCGVSTTKLLSMAGNAMTVNVIAAIGQELLRSIEERSNYHVVRVANS